VIGVLASGRGTNLQALIDDGLPNSAVAANRKDAYALVRAREAGVATATFSLDCHESREERDLLMARIAGMRLRERWGGWRREPFRDESPKHVSVWEKTAH
jgi:folate-dependent phosphoribosylglycinamide formyltransferase PurN